ncbi:Ubiquitin-like protein [Elasticomyces elasticus]|nr:Ubiquitin-like protein [Elasticomyces elasticus]KAK3646634.1 Ubiquitin-like protein [Elasticomyces elasticus]KAK4913790.1 Ubiquitin-like protein [Elasticomyces elasticus]KAK5758001.1 Ubiquitin-like protein [Elasticomyces elasticus]
MDGITTWRSAKRLKPYVYERLDPKRQEIRLLEVLPDEPGQPMQVKLRATKLPANYETISYAWGNPARTACIEIRSGQRRQLRVPFNTEAALKRVRRHDRVRTVWIDAICINQDSIEDRNQQVAIMGRIYSSSLGNLVYLGELEDPNMAPRIQHTIDDLLKHARSETDDLRSLQLGLRDMLRALVWWKRHATSDDQDISSACICLSSLYYHLSKRGDWYARSVQSLYQLLMTAQEFQKSEPRDSVFALLSIMDEKSSSALSPDYTRPLSDILESASRLAIQETQLVLGHIHHRPGDLERAEVASWAMRVDRELDFEIDPVEIPQGYHQTYPVSEGPDETTGGWKSGVLYLVGRHADSVSMVAPVCTPSIYDDHEAFSVWLWQTVQSYTSVSGPSSREVKATTIAKTLCADNYNLRRYQQMQDDERMSLEEGLLVALSPETTERTLNLLQAPHTYAPTSDGIFWVYLRNRRCFVTQQRRLGIGPRETQSGDIVAMLSGAEHPYILRPLDDEQYQLVGAAYVDGLMPGDLGVEWHSKEEEVFALV